MDFLEMLKSKLDMITKSIEDKKALADLTTDAVKQKEIGTAILGLVEEKGAINEQIKAEEKRLSDEREALKGQSQVKAAMSFQTPASKIEVGLPADYKGFKIRAEIDSLKFGDKISPVMKARWQAAPEKAEVMAKFMCDLLAQAEEFSKGGPAAVARMKTVLAEGTTYSGAELVNPEVREELFSYLRDESIALQDATRVRMNSNTLELNGENAKVNAYFGAEADATAASDPTFQTSTLTARRMSAYSTTSNELLQDTFVNGGITGILLPQFIEAIGQRIDSTVFIGSGADSAVFSGVFLAVTGYSQVFGSGSTNFSELLESDVRGIVAKIPERYVSRNGKWYINQATLYNYFYGLKDGNERPLFVELVGGGPGVKQLWGYPVKCPTVAYSTSANGRAMAVFGNLQAVYIGERLTDFTLIADPFTALNTYQTKYYIFTRWGFALPLPNMLGRIATAAT